MGEGLRVFISREIPERALARLRHALPGAVLELTVEDGLREPWVVGVMLIGSDTRYANAEEPGGEG